MGVAWSYGYSMFVLVPCNNLRSASSGATQPWMRQSLGFDGLPVSLESDIAEEGRRKGEG